MTLEEQRARMLSGQMYNDLTPELIAARARAVSLTDEYSRSISQQPAEREAILRRLLGHVGPGALFEPTFRCEFGFNISIGSNFYANFDCVILDGGSVDIGDYVLFGPRVGIYTSNHAIDPNERAAGACYAKPVRIGNRVWIGAGVHINQGVTIGDNSIIGSGSVITRDIPANVIAAGVPCRVIRAITEKDITGFSADIR
ncbi:MAG: sugar O-acetyltransferase [Rhizobiaceae bacterium]|nr:sugar O-acetyltransferase [Rhizobiaceae bacterium]